MEHLLIVFTAVHETIHIILSYTFCPNSSRYLLICRHTLHDAISLLRWDNYGQLRWQLVLCLLLAWILIGLSMIKGLASYGKVAYFITLSPYVGKSYLPKYLVQDQIQKTNLTLAFLRSLDGLAYLHRST